MARYVTTNLRLDTATYEELKLRAERAVAVARELLRSKRYELIFIDSPVLDGALERMNRFADKRLSLAACASMELIDRLRLGGAFTFDADFRDCGVRSFP